MRPLLAGLALLAAVALSACGDTIDAEEQEEFVRDVVVREIGARVASVRCPEDVERREGDTFGCTVTATDDSTGSVVVTQQEDSKIQVVAPFLHMGQAEAVIADGIANQLEADDVDVECPEIVVVRKNRLLRCDVAATRRSRTVSVRLTDDSGGFRYRLERRTRAADSRG